MNGATAHYTAAGWETLAAEPGWAAAAIAGAAFALALAVGASWRERRVLAPRRWGWLVLLRLVALAGGALAVAGIERREVIETVDPSRVVVLVDSSASMNLPDETPGGASRRRAAESATGALFKALRDDHQVLGATFGDSIKYTRGGLGGDSTSSSDASTRLGDALETLLADHAAVPLAGVVVLSDGASNRGADPLRVAGAYRLAEKPIHTIGFGPRIEPRSIALRDLTAPSRVFARDRLKVLATVAASGLGAGEESLRVVFRIRPVEPSGSAPTIEQTVPARFVDNAGTATATLEIEPPDPGRYSLTAEALAGGADADPSDNKRETVFEVVDQPTRVLLAAGGPSRDYRFLLGQLRRDESFRVETLLQTDQGPPTDDRLIGFPASAESLEQYDAIVAYDLNWSSVDEASQQAMLRWVSRRGGGLVFVAGSVHTALWVRRGEGRVLAKLLPVELRDDPLAMSLGGAVSEALPVRLTPDGRRAPFMKLSEAAAEDDWRRIEGLYCDPLPAEPKLGAIVHASLGGEAESDRAPLLVEQPFGAGRVFYLATGQAWRLRAIDPAWFTSFTTNLVRHATQGRLSEAEAAGALYFDRDKYEVGQPMTLRLSLRTPRGEGGDPGPLVWTGPDGERVGADLRPAPDQPGLYLATHAAQLPGRYEARLAWPEAGGETLRAETEVALPSLELSAVVRDEAVLRGLAEQTGGVYAGADDDSIAALAKSTPSRAEVVTTLGPPDREHSERLAKIALAMLAGGLLLEWGLRRWWRLA